MHIPVSTYLQLSAAISDFRYLSRFPHSTSTGIAILAALRAFASFSSARRNFCL